VRSDTVHAPGLRHMSASPRKRLVKTCTRCLLAQCAQGAARGGRFIVDGYRWDTEVAVHGNRAGCGWRTRRGRGAPSVGAGLGMGCGRCARQAPLRAAFPLCRAGSPKTGRFLDLVTRTTRGARLHPPEPGRGDQRRPGPQIGLNTGQGRPAAGSDPTAAPMTTSRRCRSRCPG
jgi:hypothetical protein